MNPDYRREPLPGGWRQRSQPVMAQQPHDYYMDQGGGYAASFEGEASTRYNAYPERYPIETETYGGRGTDEFYGGRGIPDSMRGIVDSGRGAPGAGRGMSDFNRNAPESYGHRMPESSFRMDNRNNPVYPTMEDRYSSQQSSFPPTRKRVREEYEHGSAYNAKLSRLEKVHSDGMHILLDESKKCINEMTVELDIIDNAATPDMRNLIHARRTLYDEINRLSTTTNPEWLDMESNKYQIRILKRVLIPPFHPGNNIVGRLMGVRGSTLKRLCQTHKCHISICGKGSRRTPAEENRLLESGDQRYAHLAWPLHAEVTTSGPPHLAYPRLGRILELLHRVITTEDRFEVDGLVFESSSYRAPRHEDDREQNSRSRNSSENDRPGISPKIEEGEDEKPNGHDDGTEFSNRDEEERPTTSSRGRGRRGGGYIPRRSGGFIPRRRGE